MAEPTYTPPPNDPPVLGSPDFAANAQGYLGWFPTFGAYCEALKAWFKAAGTIPGILDGQDLNNVTLGLTTPAAACFTTLTVSGVINFDTDGFFYDPATGRMGIGTNTPGRHLHVYSSQAAPMRVESTGTTYSMIDFMDANTTDGFYVQCGAVGNDFMVYAGGGEGMRITSSKDAGFGTSTPITKVDIVDAFSGAQLRMESTVGNAGLDIKTLDNGDVGFVYFGNTTDSVYAEFDANLNSGTPKFDWYTSDGGGMTLYSDGTDGHLGVGQNGQVPNIIKAFTSQASVDALRVHCASGSYAKDELLLDVNRSASTAFNYLSCRSQVAGSIDTDAKIDGTGAFYSDPGTYGNGADYAEYFEWHPDVLATIEAMDVRGLPVVLDGRYIRLALPGEEPIGVVSANPSVVGDADIGRWKDKYLRDDFNETVWEDYEVVSWTEEVQHTKTVTEQATEEVSVEVDTVEIVDGAAVMRKTTKTVSRKLFDEYPLVDDAGDPITERVQVGKENGIPVYEDRPLIHREPRMVEVEKPGRVEKVVHSYAADEVPEGVVVPEDAERVTQQRKKLNPEFDPTLEYVPRAERPEWAVIGLVGKLRVVKGQPVGSGWIKMRDISAEVEEWLVR